MAVSSTFSTAGQRQLGAELSTLALGRRQEQTFASRIGEVAEDVRNGRHRQAIVSNSQALKTKYRTNGFTAIKAAVDKLIAADARRHIKSKLIFIDDAAAMTKLGGTLPVNPTDQRGAKKAVDAIVASLAPDYVVLLDGPDVIPHIVLDNPVPNDLDDTVDSDLPYASDIGFSNQ